MIRKSSPFVAILVAGLMLAGCGRAGKPQAPEGSAFPTQYPNPALQTGAVVPASPDRSKFIDPSVDFQNVFSADEKNYVDPAEASTPLAKEPDGRPATFFPIP